MAVERLEGRLEPGGKGEGIEPLRLAAPLLRHVLADVLPQVAEHRHVVAGDVLGHGDAWQLHDAALDGVHEREVAHRPREERSLGVARPAQEEGRRGEVDHAREPELAVHRLQAGDPEAGGLVVPLGLLSVVALQVVVLVLVAAASRGSSGAPRRSGRGCSSAPSARASRAGASALRSRACPARRRRAPGAARARPSRAPPARGA